MGFGEEGKSGQKFLCFINSGLAVAEVRQKKALIYEKELTRSEKGQGEGMK